MTAVPVATLERFPSFDYGVVGEGEVTLLELLERIAAGAPPADVRGVAWRDPAGQVRRNAARPLLADLDELPMPAWDLLPGFPHGYPHSILETRRRPAASLMTSRGCPYQCTFCDSLVFGHTVRTHSAGYTLDMIRFLRKRYGIRDLMMLDDKFILRHERLFEICDAMVRERMGLQWYCMGHARTMTPERLRKIREAGCWIIEMGIESGCDRILKRIEKGPRPAEVADRRETRAGHGLKVKGNFIFGLPTRRKRELGRDDPLRHEIGLSYFQQNCLTVWPGCELSADPGRYGTVETDWEKLAHQRVTFVPTGMTEEDLLGASKQAFRRFYLRPRIVLELLPLLSSWRGAQALVAGFVGFLRTMLRPGSAPHPAP